MSVHQLKGLPDNWHNTKKYQKVFITYSLTFIYVAKFNLCVRRRKNILILSITAIIFVVSSTTIVKKNSHTGDTESLTITDI